MEAYEKEKRFLEEVEKLLQRFTSEYDMTYAQLLGCFDVIKNDLIQQLMEEEVE